MKVLGYKLVNYTSNKGFEVSGVELHCTVTDKRITGYGVDKIYVSDRVLAESGYTPDELIGAEIRIMYNRYGKPESIQAIN